MSELSAELQFAIDVCKEAGKIALKHFQQGVEVTKKPDNTPVTIADKECEKLIREIISQRYPDDAILGEEEAAVEAKSNSTRKWIVDPIDGTYNFARGISIFSVLLALEEDGEIVIGVIHNPAVDETIYAEKGCGAFRNGKQIYVSKVAELEDSQFVFGAPNRILACGLWDGFTRVIKQTYRQRGLGDYLNFAYVFEGKAEAMIETGLSAWDIAPMKIIALEAGGKFSDLEGGESVYKGNCLISNGKVHEAFWNLLKNS